MSERLIESHDQDRSIFTSSGIRMQKDSQSNEASDAYYISGIKKISVQNSVFSNA